jgi:hypothetical protein
MPRRSGTYGMLLARRGYAKAQHSTPCQHGLRVIASELELANVFTHFRCKIYSRATALTGACFGDRTWIALGPFQPKSLLCQFFSAAIDGSWTPCRFQQFESMPRPGDHFLFVE